MNRQSTPRPRAWLQLALVLAAAPALAASASPYGSLDPKAISVLLAKDLPWEDRGNGSESVALAGDASKPGLYVVLVKWRAHHNSHPHFHPNDRFITVLSGTWWV